MKKTIKRGKKNKVSKELKKQDKKIKKVSKTLDLVKESYKLLIKTKQDEQKNKNIVVSSLKTNVKDRTLMILIVGLLCFLLGFSLFTFLFKIDYCVDKNNNGICDSDENQMISRYFDNPGKIITLDKLGLDEGGLFVDFPMNLKEYMESNSMIPLLYKGATGLSTKPENPDIIDVGHVISFHADWKENVVVHRVVRIGYDDYGWYAITQGDNLLTYDPGKVRFEQVESVLVGVLY